MKKSFIEIKDKDLAGRIGKIKTKRGVIETPYLFPVIDPIRQEVPVSDIKKIGFNAVITNAYLLYKKGWRNDIHSIDGLKDLIVMTDSGAYQLLEYGSVDVTNREIIDAEKMFDSDIAVILDVPTGDTLDRRTAEYTVTETLRRGVEALELIDEDRLWVLPIQGGVHLDLIEYSSKESSKLDYDIYALGSPTRFMERYEYDVILDMISFSKKHLPPDKPLHLFGAGHPMMIPFAVAMGVDLFDSASYVLFARDDRYMTDKGTLKLDELDFLPCNCPVCSRYSAQELKKMDKRERTKLLAIHNLYVIKKVLNETKQAIREGRLWSLLEEFSRKHPSLYDAFLKIVEKSEWLENFTPRIKSTPKGIKLYDKHSLHNPTIKRVLNYINMEYRPPPLYESLLIKPIEVVLKEEKKGSKTHVVNYHPLVGLVPSDLSRTYPFNYLLLPKKVDGELEEKTASTIISYIEKFSKQYKGITAYICKDHNKIYEILKDFEGRIRLKNSLLIELIDCSSSSSSLPAK